MLNFKKNGIFSRSTSEETTAPELQGGGVVAVWGSPGSGKTTMAVKMAKYLADKKRNVVLLLCDMTAPMLPCICPASELECERSLGSVLAAAHVTENLVKNNLITHKRLGYLTILGMLKGENEYTYPPYGEAQARELIDCLREVAPYVAVSYTHLDVYKRQNQSYALLTALEMQKYHPTQSELEQFRESMIEQQEPEQPLPFLNPKL